MWHKEGWWQQRSNVQKNVWFDTKENEVEHGMVTGVARKGVWQGLREIQKGRPPTSKTKND